MEGARCLLGPPPPQSGCTGPSDTTLSGVPLPRRQEAGWGREVRQRAAENVIDSGKRALWRSCVSAAHYGEMSVQFVRFPISQKRKVVHVRTSVSIVGSNTGNMVRVCVSPSRHTRKYPYASICCRGRKWHTVKARKGKRRVCMAHCALLASVHRCCGGRKGVPSAWQD